MRQKPPYLVLALAALLAFPLRADEAKEVPAGKSAAPSTAAALKAHVDPATGQLVSTPDPSTRTALTTAPAGALPALKVENGKTKAGGKRIRLDDRFMMEMSATASPSGKVSQTCVAEHEKAGKASPAKEDRHDR